MNSPRWHRIKQVYGSVLERKPEQREAFLDEACAGDETLRKEVASLLAQVGRSEGLFDSPALDVAAKALAGDQAQEPSPDLTGHTLSHYRIHEKIGEGGMGVVYRAEDTNLNRQVAIKVLPETFLNDRERLARFQREAQLLASLNHPNIAAIYGLERTESSPLLIMELIEGKTLAERLAKGPLPVVEALTICREIAEGLEAAHEKGIVHRDLKPANVKITPEGQAKILDFGLAKALQGEPDSSEHSPEISEVQTRTGVILGTAAYMSPEQANGRAVDKRADIWAFGCILFECLTGKRAFEAETATETMAAILKSEPDWNLFPAAIPWRTKDLLHRCLQKDPRERLHDIADARIEIEESVSEPPQVTPTAQRFPLRWVLSISTVALLIGVLTGPAMMRYFRPPASPSQPVIRTSIRLGPGQWLDGLRMPYLDRPTRTAMALSGDGRFLVYSAIKENPTPQDQPRLYLRRLDQLEGKP
ncbi:MAG: serine/threonine protein kinase, partial [Acidobacteria bacterium]